MHLRIGLLFLLAAAGTPFPINHPTLCVVCAQSEGDVREKDLPRIPPTEPQDALATFQLVEGFRLELVAAEPMVSDPVDACFDERGRMFVAEMHGYPFSQEPTKLNPQGGGKVDAGIIRLLEDTDGDAVMDRSHIFADNISWPTSVCCYNGGIFVLAPQYLYYFKDTDGDHVADVREIVLSGFCRGNVQALANGLRWGLDNRIYFAAGRNPAELSHRGKPLFSASGRDIRFDPRTEEFELVSGGQQFGHTIDDWGNRFVCSNSNHIQHVVYPQHYLARNRYLAVRGLIRDIAVDGASSRVFRASPPEPWRIIRQQWRAKAKGYRLVIDDDGAWKFIPLDPAKDANAVPTEYPVGFFTSATGITIYRGHAYGTALRGNAFVGDVGGNLVHRKTLVPSGVTFAANRADPNEEFIRSSDNWFRPVSFVNAPDGTLYILDMYRETIEHPHSIPIEIKQFLDLQSGSERGRVYRIRGPNDRPSRVARLDEMGISQLVAELDSENGWSRETAQRLLCGRQDDSAAALLEKLLQTASARGKLHALYSLAGLGQLKAEHLRRALQDSHPRVREHAILLSEAFINDTPDLVDLLLQMSSDGDERVRYQLAFTLGELKGDRALTGLARLATSGELSDEVRIALISSVERSAGQLMERLLKAGDFIERPHAAALFSELGLIAGADENERHALRALTACTEPDVPAEIQQVVLGALGEGIRRRGRTLSDLLTGETVSATLRRQVDQLFARARIRASDEQLPLETRAAAIGLLAFEDAQAAIEDLAPWLLPQTPPPLQMAAVSALASINSDSAGKVLVDGWRGFGPATRREVIDALLSSKRHLATLLVAVQEGAVLRGDLERDKKQFLLNHPDRNIRRQSGRLFGAEVDSDRAEVVAAHQPVLALEGDQVRGLAVFKKHCATCHRVGGMGHQVAPDLASVKNKSPDDLLVAILDPNREAQPNFTSYALVTHEGRVHNGIIVTETANSVTLRRAEGKEDVVLRSNIEELVSSGKSLMPEGLEKDLSHQDLADVISFLKSMDDSESRSGQE